MMSSYVPQADTAQWIRQLIAAGCIADFYRSASWKRVRAQILAQYRNECQECRKRGKYSRADTVHHIQYLKKHPDLALSPTYLYKGKERPNLWPVCHDCHEKIHGARRLSKVEPLTPERW